MDVSEVKRPLQVYMPLDLLNWVQKKAKEQDRSMTWIVNQALAEQRKSENEQSKGVAQ